MNTAIFIFLILCFLTHIWRIQEQDPPPGDRVIQFLFDLFYAFAAFHIYSTWDLF
jgi:hypothetical protein